MKIKRTILMLILLLTFLSCDDNYVSSIPSYPVSLQLNLLTGQYVTFRNSTNEYLLFTKPIIVTDRIGFGGILVYTGISLDDSNNTIYYAFDLACPYEAKSNIKVSPVKDALGQVKCSECGSVYDVGFGLGNPIEGPSKEILKRYKTSFSGDVLYIYR
jgi:hypothetical protein